MAIPIAHLSRRFAAQLIDAGFVLVLGLFSYYGTALSPLQFYDDRIQLQPFPLVPFLSALELTYALPEPEARNDSPWLGPILAISGRVDPSDESILQHTVHWITGSRATFTFRPAWSRGLLMLWLLHATLAVGYSGQTLGKRMMGLRVVRGDGAAVGYGRSFVRAVFYLPSAVLYVAIPWLAVGVWRRWWHDWVAGTRVVGT